MILIVDNRYATNKKPGNNQNKDLVNENVRFPEVLLIGPNGEQLGTMSSREAQFKANEYDLDLSLFYEDCPKIESDITEIPIDKLQVVIDRLEKIQK